MMVKAIALACLSAGLLLPGLAAAQGRWNAAQEPGTWRAPQQSVESPPPASRRDPTGILRGQGVSSLHGGMGNMGGGSGRSANTGIGLGGIGANQGARF